MYNVAIIGAGQLGSRHLQGLKGASSPLSIFVMDSSEDSLRIAKERYEAVPAIGDKIINFVTTIENLPDQLDLVIIATGSKPRASIVKSLVKHGKIRYLVLEKVLFPSLEDYDEVGLILKENGIRCWVNCTRRMYGLYKEISQIINTSLPIKMTNKNENWGLCCNSIHMIDIFMYFTGENTYTLNIDGLNNKIEDSKRSGYIEMTGTIVATTPQGSELTLTSVDGYNGVRGIIIQNGEHTINILESSNTWSIDGCEESCIIPFQSQLTGLLADEILKTGGCSLTQFNKSANYHKIFIDSLLSFYNIIKNTPNNKVLPIT